MINSRSLILFTALVAYAPAASYGFLTTVKCTNVSDACANVPEVLPNQALRPNLASMRDPHELHSHRGVDSLRQSSWQLDHLFDSKSRPKVTLPHLHSPGPRGLSTLLAPLAPMAIV